MIDRVSSRRSATSWFAWMVLAFASALASALLPADAQTPSAEQLQMFQNLTPEQQQAILESLGQGNGARSDVRADQQLSFPQTMRPRQQYEGQQDEIDPITGLPRKPRLKGDDTILLSLEIRQFEGPDEPPSSQQLLNQQGQLNQAQPVGAAVPAATGPGQTAPRKPIVRTETETERLQEIRDRVHRRNPYKLDKYGILNIPELGPVPLAGLTVEQANQRLNADINLKEFKITVTLLPLKPVGTDALNPFGYDLFAGAPSTFAPATDVPVPSEYVVGPGDTINVQLIGNTKGNYGLVVGRDGQINFPELGPIAVGGMRFEQVRTLIETRVREQMIGTQVSVGAGELRSIRVFVMGDAEQPGSYTVSGLSTITNALFVSGGVKKIGSLRNIELKRNGQTVTRLDLYDLLLRGDTRADARLLPGDVIFVPPVGLTVGLGGEVRRPAIYELKGETTAAELISLGGGLMPQADPKLATLERVDENQQRVMLDVNLTIPAGQGVRLRNGDTLLLPSIRTSLEDSVTLTGHVYRPGAFQYRAGMRLSDVLPSVDELKPNGDQHYILIRRELPPDRRITVFSADLAGALNARGSAVDIPLAPRDRLYVFDLESGRDRIVEPLLRDLRTQSSLDSPTQQVRIGGKAKVPGQYPLEPGMRVSDLIRAGGSLDEAAFGSEAELTRYALVDGQARQTELIEIDLDRMRAGDPSADIELRPFDYLVIKEIPRWSTTEEIELKGEVRFPGVYPIHHGETLRSVLERAGGLTELAFVEGSVFTRKELKEREKKQVETLVNRMQGDLAQLSLQVSQETGKDAAQALAVGQSLLTNLKEAEPTGRLVIDLKRTIAASPGTQHDIILRDGDQLVIPRITQEVTVIGEVQSSTSHLYDSAFGRDDYVSLSGGLTQRADKDRIYVVRANGSVIADSGSSWFSSRNGHIETGDTIVVPLDAERMRALPMWTAVTTIIYNLAIAAAAVNSF